jgi:dinuclear metal center YbgI/SA1388 family protein
MTIGEITGFLENYAPSDLQESYDNAGLIIGSNKDTCTGVLAALDATEAVVDEAVRKNCNLIVAHHPIIFGGIKKLSGNTYIERTVLSAIRNNIAVYAIHTNLDNVLQGVNSKIANALGLTNVIVLEPKEGILKKLVTFIPVKHAEVVKDALFKAGAGNIGNYSDCSFSVQGKGTFKAGVGTNPFVGEIDTRHTEEEVRIEMVFPGYLQSDIVKALLQAHPYEEVAYDIYAMDNLWMEAGSGLVGILQEAIGEKALLELLKEKFKLSVIRHTPFLNRKISKIAVCGGAGSFLTKKAKAAGAQAFITGDIKYHEFFDADGTIFLADIGHYESEQFTIDLLADILRQKFPNFAVLKTEIVTNPIRYFV